jgi:hypothetical protein
VDPIDMPDRRKSKSDPARVSDAHNSDAHTSEAHKPGAQTKAFSASSKLRGINQGDAAAADAVEPEEQAKRAADADSPNGRAGRAQPADAVDSERVHCLGCDHTFNRVELNVVGNCASCAAQRKAEQAAAEAAYAAQQQDPAEVAAAAAELRRQSLERQAKRRGITVDELLAKRQPRT